MSVATISRRLRLSDRGASAIEYALLASLISIVALTAVRTTGVGVNAVFNRVGTTASNVLKVDPAIAVAAQVANLKSLVWIQSNSTQHYGPPNFTTAQFKTADGLSVSISQYTDGSGQLYENFFDVVGHITVQTYSDATGSFYITANRTYDANGTQLTGTDFTYNASLNRTTVGILSGGVYTTSYVSGPVGNPGTIVAPVFN